MTSVTMSTFELGAVQEDGRTPVLEIHTISNGDEYQYEYLNDGSASPMLVMSMRADHINVRLAQIDAATILIYGTEIPMSNYEFTRRFTFLEREAIRTRAETNRMVFDAMDALNRVKLVYRSNPDTVDALSLFVYLGDLQPHRIAEILAP